MINHKKQRKQVVQCILFIFVILIGITVLLPVAFATIGYTDTMNISAFTCFIYLHAFRYLQTSQFVLVALALRSRFNAINEHLANLKSVKGYLLMVRKPFHQLCDVIEIINQTFTMQLVFNLGIILVREHG